MYIEWNMDHEAISTYVPSYYLDHSNMHTHGESGLGAKGTDTSHTCMFGFPLINGGGVMYGNISQSNYG